MERKETIRTIKEFIELVSGLPVVVKKKDGELILRLGMAQPLVLTHTLRGPISREDLEYGTWARFLEVFSMMMIQREEFNQWLEREKVASN